MIIVGAGLAALYAALKLAPYPVLVISPETLGEGASSTWAQGGIAAAMDLRDSPALHAKDTINAGAGTVIPDIVSRVTQAARDHILDLTRLGAPFDRSGDGSYVLSREAAHSLARIVRVKGDQAGAGIMQALIHAVRNTPSIQVAEGVMATALKVSTGRVVAVDVCRSGANTSASIRLFGAAHVLAGGGSGGLYALTTNPRRIRGEVVGMAARAGAVIADPEFVQFHPTAIDVGLDPAPLATEALRGSGARLVNKNGTPFMTGQHPKADLAPRDIVARAVFAQKQEGLRPALDARSVFAESEQTCFPTVTKTCLSNGINPTTEPIPVAPAAHYHMGGIATGPDGATSLPGLWACGETASTGLHGANRLASNGLLEALVFAESCAQDILAHLTPAPTGSAPVNLEFRPGGSVPDKEGVAQLRQLMTQHVGVIRTADGLRQALSDIARLEASLGHCLPYANMTATATLIAAAALMREESRGAHYRDDFPRPQCKTGARTKITLAQALDLRNHVQMEFT